MDKFFLIFKKLFPISTAFSLFIDKNLTKFIYSLTALPNDFRNYINLVYLDLFPNTTRALELWCETFGLNCNNEDNARMDLDTSWKATGGQAWEYIQEILNNAGYNVLVHENNPPVDPDIFLKSIPWMVAGGLYAYAGNDEAVAGKTGGDLLVNSDIFTNVPDYNSVAGISHMVAGNTLAKAGQFTKFITIEKIYSITNNPDLWGAFFFIGGDATRDPVTNELTAIENVNIDVSRKKDFENLILKLKPGQTWAGLMVNYT